MVVLTNSMPSSVIRGAMFVPIDKQYLNSIVYNLALYSNLCGYTAIILI